MLDAINIHWFPGHMTRANRKMQQSLKLVDCVAEIIDARIPISSRNPELIKMTQNKPKLLLFNKTDIADPLQNSSWITYYKNKGFNILSIDAKTGKGLNKFSSALRVSLKDKIQQWEKKGMGLRKIRVMVVGIPNVGKSSCINRLVGNKKAKVEDRPGVTRGNQWFYLSGGVELLDTPGVLWPKISDQIMGENLAFTGAVRDHVIDIEGVALRFINRMVPSYPDNLCQRYKLTKEFINTHSPLEIFYEIGRKRGLLISGGEIDTQRLSQMLLDEFRMARLGRITLEKVEDIKK